MSCRTADSVRKTTRPTTNMDSGITVPIRMKRDSESPALACAEYSWGSEAEIRFNKT